MQSSTRFAPIAAPICCPECAVYPEHFLNDAQTERRRQGNLLVIFGEPDIDMLDDDDDTIRVRTNGVDVLHPPADLTSDWFSIRPRSDPY